MDSDKELKLQTRFKVSVRCIYFEKSYSQLCKNTTFFLPSVVTETLGHPEIRYMLGRSLTNGHHFHQHFKLDQKRSKSRGKSGRERGQGRSACHRPHLTQRPETYYGSLLMRCIYTKTRDCAANCGFISTCVVTYARGIPILNFFSFPTRKGRTKPLGRVLFVEIGQDAAIRFPTSETRHLCEVVER